jgi:menaquinone-dependent protoporphyrinogen oxidase
MAKILFLYSTTDGHTRTICSRLKAAVERDGHEAVLHSIVEEPTPDLGAFDKIVVGASIRYGKHKPHLFEFVERHRAVLDARPNAFFTVNVVARKPEKNSPDTNPYMRKFLAASSWQPKRLAVFAGRIDYPRLGVLDRTVIRFIMWLTKGPTDPSAVVEFTDWARVDAFGRTLSEL